MISGMAITKMVAVFIGVEGMALIGNLRNFLTTVQSFSTLGFYNSAVKSISELRTNNLQLSKALSTNYYLGFIATIFTSVVSYYNADVINSFLFSGAYQYDYIIKIMALALPFYALNVFSFSIMSGFSKHRMLLVINAIGQVVGVLITFVLIYNNHIDGAMIAIVITPSLLFFITLVGFLNQRNLVSEIKIQNVSFDVLKKFGSPAIMGVVTVCATPLITIVIRNYLIDQVGIREAGLWEGMLRLSHHYLIFLVAMVSMFLFPKFNANRNFKQFRIQVVHWFKKIIPALAIGLSLVYVLRNFIISFAYSSEFLPMESLFSWQLLGDFFKVLSLILSYQLIVRSFFGHFLIIELFLVIIKYLSSIYLIDCYGVQGAVIAHFLTHILHFFILILIVSGSIFGLFSEEKEI